MGLWGRPTDEAGYERFYVQGIDGMTCWVQQEVLEKINRYSPTEEGDYLFYVEGIGRMRWSILD